MVVECIIECSRLASNQAKSDNNENYSLWTNNAGSGIKLNPGDNISVQSAYINEIGVGSDTIEIDETNNKMSLTLQFFKTGDGENLMHLPRNALDDTIAGNFNNLGGDVTEANAYNYYSVYRTCLEPLNNNTTAIVEFGGIRDHDIRSPLYNQNYFNQRLTIMTSNLITPLIAPYDNSINFEYCFFQYDIKTQNINIELPLGHLTPSNICNKVNKAFNKKIGVKEGFINPIKLDPGGAQEIVDTIPEQYNFNNKIPIYNCYQPIQCATYGSFSKSCFQFSKDNPGQIHEGIENAEPMTALYYSSFSSIAVYDPESFNFGRIFMTGGTNNLSSFNITSQSNFDVPNLGHIEGINTNIPWNDTNITNLKNWVHSQYDNNQLFKEMFPSNDRRYIHVDSDAGRTDIGKLGDDKDYTKMSIIQYIAFDVRQKDNFTNEYDGNLQYNNYGFMIHYSDPGGTGTGTIGFRLYNNAPTDKITYNYNTDANINCGYDIHYSAFGTNVFMVSNSISPWSYYLYRGKYTPAGGGAEITFNTPVSSYSITENFDTSSMINHIYVGAETAGLNFDSISSRFFFEKLYTAKKISNTPVGGLNLLEQFNEKDGTETLLVSTNVTDADTASNPNAGDPIYQLNPILRPIIYNPEFWLPMVNAGDLTAQKSFFTSYNPEISIIPPPASKTSIMLLQKPLTDAILFNNNLNFYNQNIKYDSQSGIWIFFNNLTSKNLFSKSIWNLIGYTYEGLKLDQINYDRQMELNSLNLTSFPFTTNTENNASYVESQNSNPYGEPLFVPWCYNPLTSINEQLVNDEPIQRGHNPEVNISTLSFKILAENKPIKQKYPYYTIRSDIILNKNYIGGHDGINLPVVAIANKAYVSDDYYFMISSNMNFTVDSPTILTSITQSIHNPLGELASVDPSCSVIYMITKNIQIQRPLIQQQQQQQQQQKKITPPQQRR